MAMYLLSASTQADFGLVLLECNCMMSGFASDPPRPELEKQLCVTPADVKVPTVPADNEQHKSATPARINLVPKASPRAKEACQQSLRLEPSLRPEQTLHD